ncbi:MAG TPA: RagB/SusD family nutrient uptake outer membrane protein [Chitinophagaceae bacterium]|nr:RagB/SusD family nutrient uptake outer membrane protein [Chitinophagaceae bacterium]
MKKQIIIISVFALLVQTGCKTEYTNPNAPTDVEVLNTVEGMTRLIVGIKNRFATNVLAPAVVYQGISASGLTTREVSVLNAGNADLAQVENGGNNLAPNNGVIGSLWTTANIINSEAQKLIDGSASIPDINTKNAVRIYGHLYKALALGTMAIFWEKVPINTGENAVFSTRAEALQQAVTLLDEASGLLASTQVPAAFTASVGNEIDLVNTLRALAARYYMMLGNNDLAIARANAVDLTKRSVFFYNNTNPNPVFRSSLTNNNTYGIRTNFGLSGALLPDPADKRIVFHLTRNAANGSGFFLGDATAIPIYQPGEMLLIQAEANARKNSFTAAKAFLDQVLTKQPASDIFGVGADLPAYSGSMTQTALLDEIYKNRCIEMYLSGLKLEDSRRFQRPGPGATNSERSRNFYPYPQQERDGNPNTPEDPLL